MSSESDQRVTPDPGVPPRPDRWLVLAAGLGCLFSVNVTITILAVSIHTISIELDTTEVVMTWVVTGPLLAFGVVGPLMGKLGDRIGHRKVLLWGMVAAVVMAGASGLAWDATSLIAFRTLGGVAGAAIGPATFAMITRTFPQTERVRALGYWAMIGAGAPVVGVVAGGPLVEAFGWRTIFFAQVPITIGALYFAWRVLPATPKRAEGRFDLAGAVLVALTVTPVLYALTESSRLGWTHPVILAAVAVSPVAAVLFVRVERRASNPLLPLRYLRVPGFTFAILSQAFINAAYMGSFILTPLLLQNLLGHSETRTGLISIARPLAFALAGVFAGNVARRMGSRPAAMVGSVGVMVALMWMATFGLGTGDLIIMAALALAGLGMGVAMPPLSASVTVSVDEHDLGIAGASQQMVIQVGTVVGIQLMQAIQQGRVEAVGLEASYRWGYLGGAVLAVVGVLAATRIAAPGGTGERPSRRARRGRLSDAISR